MVFDRDHDVWLPISLDELQARIVYGETLMESATLALWKRLRVPPVKWSLPPWSKQGDGFWVVAVWGRNCVWYNDIEDGFECSIFEEFGRIGQYQCSQSELHHIANAILQEFMREIVRDDGMPKPDH